MKLIIRDVLINVLVKVKLEILRVMFEVLSDKVLDVEFWVVMVEYNE